jgi:hypothetical protein
MYTCLIRKHDDVQTSMCKGGGITNTLTNPVFVGKNKACIDTWIYQRWDQVPKRCKHPCRPVTTAICMGAIFRPVKRNNLQSTLLCQQLVWKTSTTFDLMGDCNGKQESYNDCKIHRMLPVNENMENPVCQSRLHPIKTKQWSYIEEAVAYRIHCEI